MFRAIKIFTLTIFFAYSPVFSAMNSFASHNPLDFKYNEQHLAAIELARAGKYEQALELIEMLLEKQKKPSNVLLFDYIAILEWTGNHQKAVAEFNKQPVDFQKNIPVYVKESLVNAYYSIGDYKQVLVFYQDANFEADPLQKQKAQLFLGRISLDDVTQDVQLGFALDLAKKADFEKALPIYQKFYIGKQLSVVQFYDYITVLSWAGENEMAAKLFEQQNISADSMPDYMLINMGELYSKLQQWDKAKGFYQTAGKRGNYQSQSALSSLLIKQGENQEAFAFLNSIVNEHPERPDSYLLRAQAYIMIGHVFEAAIDYDKALSLIPEKEFNYRREIIAGQALNFLHAGEYAYSIDLLTPYVKKEMATINMQCDYVYALKMNKSYKAGAEAAQNMWHDITLTPSYGLLAAGDCALAIGDQNTALKYYRQIATTTDAEKGAAIAKISQIKNQGVG